MNRKFNAEFKGKVALEAIKGEKTIAQISSEYKVHCNQVSKWKKQLLSNIKEIFSGRAEKSQANNNQEIDELFKQIGQLKVENDFLKKTAYRF